MKVNKFEYLHVLQADYGYGHGWEDLTASEDRRAVAADLRAYRENAPGPRYRMVQRRERKP